MKKLFLYFVVAIFLLSCKAKVSNEQLAQLWHSYKAHDFFRLENLMRRVDPSVKNPEIMLFKAKIGYVFNKPKESDSIIKILLKKYASKFNDTIVADLYYMKSINETRLENYKDACQYGKYVVDNYTQLYDSTFIDELKDDVKIREALSNVPKMDVIKVSDSQIPITRDIAGLINVPVVLGSDSINFIFDTGANMSLIVSSIARKYGFKLLGKKVSVLAFTGKKLEADLALVNLKIGNIEIKNSAFLVFADSLFSFGKGAYVIKGVIGFPIMCALKELVFKNNKLLFVPKTPKEVDNKNFALDEVTPVILVKYNNDSLPFHFDTGADRTALYVSFFNKYKDYIIKNCRKVKDREGSAGGEVEVEAYVLDKAVLSAGNVQTQLDSLKILTRSLIREQKAYYYGNLGQDFIKKYADMSINFASMNISFSK